MTVIAQNQKGEFLQVAIEPLAVQPGDSVQQVGNQLIVTRGGQVVAIRNLTGDTASVSSIVESGQVIDRAIFFRSYPVPGQSQVLQSVNRNTATDEVSFNFADGNSSIFPSWEQAKQDLQALDSTPEFAQKILMYKSIANSPDGTNMTTMVGVQCAVNFQAAVPIALIEQ